MYGSRPSARMRHRASDGASGIIRHPHSDVSRRIVPWKDRTFAEAQLLSAQLLYGRITRRAFLRRAAAIGLSASTIAMILDACGGGAPAPTATSAAPQPTATIAADGAPGASPGSRPPPRHPPVSAHGTGSGRSSAAAGSPTTAAAASSRRRHTGQGWHVDGRRCETNRPASIPAASPVWMRHARNAHVRPTSGDGHEFQDLSVARDLLETGG